MAHVGKAVLGTAVALGLIVLAVAPAQAPDVGLRRMVGARASALAPAEPAEPVAVCALPGQETALIDAGGRRRSVRFAVALVFADPGACERAAGSVAGVAREAAAVLESLTLEEALSVEGKERARMAIAR